jgi:hypothetical protein
MSETLKSLLVTKIVFTSVIILIDEIPLQNKLNCENRVELNKYFASYWILFPRSIVSVTGVSALNCFSSLCKVTRSSG